VEKSLSFSFYFSFEGFLMKKLSISLLALFSVGLLLFVSGTSGMAGALIGLLPDSSPIFGYTGSASSSVAGANSMVGGVFASPNEANGRPLTSMSFRGYAYDRYGNPVSANVKLVLVNPYNLMIISISNPILISSVDGWWSASFGSPPIVSGNTNYVLSFISDTSVAFYGVLGSGVSYFDSSNSFVNPVNPTDANLGTRLMNIYATYEPAASPTSTPTPTATSTPVPTFTPTPTATPIPQVTLTMGVSGMGSVNPSAGIHSYDVNSRVIISASPSAGYSFNYWLLEDGSKIYSSTSTLTLTQSKTALAVFTVIPQPTSTPIPQVTLTMGVNGQGTVTPSIGSYTYNINSQVTISAVPNAGYVFSNWLFNDASTSTSSTTTLALSESKSALAIFTAIPQPTPSPTYNPSPTPTPLPTQTPAPTPMPTPIPIVTPQPTQTPTATPTPEPTPIPVETPQPTETPIFNRNNTLANDAAKIGGLSLSILSVLGLVLVNPKFFGRTKW
jgi:hypothetical protein